jgi:LacI family transcriptional regulator
MKGRLTQKEMALRLNVSQAMVSRALSGTADAIQASPATVERIRRSAVAWDYRPNAAARTLKGAAAHTLGVIIKSFADPFFGHMIGELQGFAREKHYALLLAGWSGSESVTGDETILRKFELDGLVVCGSDYCPSAARAFLDEGKPVVQIGTGKTLKGVEQVVVDEVVGLTEILRHLIDLGHRRVGFVGDASLPHMRRERLLRDLLRRSGLTRRDDWFVRVTAADARTLLACGLPVAVPGGPTAFIAADDVMAQTVLRALYEHGIRVPADVSLAGIDDIPSARLTIPALTTVRHPVATLVRNAFERVTRQAEQPAGEVERGRIVVAPELVVRESCAPPRKGDVIVA